MAFGKNPQQLNAMMGGGSFLQRARTQAQRAPRSGGGSFFWKDTFQPTESLPGDFIRVMNAEFKQQVTLDGQTIVEQTMPYVVFAEHTRKIDGKPHSCICSAGPLWLTRELRQPCPSCDIWWEDVVERRAKKNRGDKTEGPHRVGRSDRVAWEIYDYGVYVEVYDLNKDGTYRINQKTQQPFTRWVKGHPNDPQHQGRVINAKQGHLTSWSMSKSWKEVLLAEDEWVGQSCLTCGDPTGISCLSKNCAGCGAVIYSPSDSTLTKEQRDQIDYNPFQCQCGHKGYVTEVTHCRSCQSPRRASLFDVDLQIQKLHVAENKSDLRVIARSQPRPLQAPPEVLQNLTHLDLLKKFAPTPPEQQLKWMHLPPPGQLNQPQQSFTQAQAPGQWQPPQPPFQQQQPHSSGQMQAGFQQFLQQPQMQQMQQSQMPAPFNFTPQPGPQMPSQAPQMSVPMQQPLALPYQPYNPNK